jgi:uncharacterized protein YfaS (alpha-2-macroglobulin family)
MVPLSTLDEMSPQDVPVTITPPTSGKFKWISTHTLQFIPTDTLISSTEYTVTVGAGIKSMEGLPVKARSGTFSTYHLRYTDDVTQQDKNQTSQNNIIRGYNQPFLIHFNQPVDLEKTTKAISVSSNSGNVRFSTAYWKEQKSNAKDTAVEDQSMIAIYPEGEVDGNWEPSQSYMVTVGKVYPKSGGSIAITEPRTFMFSVDDIVASIMATSPRTNQSSIGQFDPTGKLQVIFYEDINLDKSRISAPHLDTVVYGEKCRVGTESNCVKEPDHQKILISFKQNIFKPGDTVLVKLDSIVSDTGRQLTSRATEISLQVYRPLVISKITSGKSLGSITVCSNNPLLQPKLETDEQKITLNPVFERTYWNYSNMVSGNYSDQPCSTGEFVTDINGNLLPSSSYTGSATLVDVFGGKTTITINFTTRTLNAHDYSLRSFQDTEVVTVADKTKLTFGARLLPEVTATVCQVGAYTYYKARNSQDADLGSSCLASVSRTIPLPAGKPGQNMFTVDIKDYFPKALGNYIVTLSSPLLPSDARQRGYQLRTLVSVTGLIVTEKKIAPQTKDEYNSLVLTGAQLSALQNMYWVIDAATRQPVTGALISLYREGSVVGTATTNNQGMAFLTPVAGAETAIATFGTDSVVISDYSSVLNYASNAGNVQRLYVYTDKPLYRPGQDINIKGIYRTGYDGYYDLPEKQQLALKVFDSSDNVISEQQLTTNTYGSITATVTLSSEAPLGSYRACIEFNCGYFEVLNYVPAAFRVTFDSKDEEINIGDQPKVPIKADYYFGVPLSSATVDYRVSSQYYHFDKYTQEYFAFNNLYRDESNQRYYYGDKYIGRGEAILDVNGEAILKPDLSTGNLDTDTSKIIILDATVKNQQGRSISAQKSFVLHAAPVYIGTKVTPSFAAAGQPMALTVKTVDPEGQPVSFGSIKVETYRVKWVSSELGQGQNSYTTWKRDRELVKTDQTRTDRSGNASVQLSVPSEGEYEVDVSSSQKGGAVGSRSWFYIYGGGAVSVRSNDDTYLNVVSNTDKLKVGETGEIVFEVPEGSAKALVTIERGKVFGYEVVDVVGSIAHYTFPVTATYYPNVYVSVVAYAPNRSVRAGSKVFTINSDQKKINLSVTSDRPTYRPGDPVNLTLTATDDGGRPLASEVSLAVVDMSVLALRGNPKKDLVNEFYGHVPLTVWTYSNFKNLLKYTNQSAADGKGGSGGDPNSDKRRGVFKEVAYWKPNIMTDATGRATVTFTLPDNLTTWQAEAVAVTTDTKVGAAYREFTTNKTVMVTPLKPRFVLPGDDFMMGATVFNRGAATFDGTITFKSSALEHAAKSDAQRISLKPNESKTVYWDVQVPLTQKPGLVTYSIDASGSGVSDAVDETLSVKSNDTYEAVATAGQTDTSATEFVYLPGSIAKDRGELTLRSSATLAVFMTDALNYLVAYPYGCTEQVASQIRAVALIQRAQAIPNLANSLASQTVVYRDKEYTMDQLIQEGLKTIYGRQNPDGGFSYWSGDRESSYWATREAVDAFRVLQDTGVSVDDARWQQATAYLYNQYNAPNVRLSDSEFIELASVLFTRAEYRNNVGLQQNLDAVIGRILKDRTTANGTVIAASRLLHRYSMSLDSARRLDAVLANKVVIDARGSFLDVSAGGSYLDTALTNTAGYVDLLSVRRQNDSQLPDLLRWILASREKDGAWGSTRNTLAVVTALSDYLEWQPETSANFAMKNTINGEVAQEFVFTPKTILTQIATLIPLSKLNSGTMNSVNFSKDQASTKSAGKIYYDMSLKYYLPATELPPRDEGLTINRGIYALTDIASEKPLKKAVVGDVVREHIEVTVPVTRRNVLIEDFIPAGMEIVDTSLATEDKTLVGVAKEVKSSWIWPTHKELRDDRYVLVIDELSPGSYQFDYFLRALVPGTYTYLPAHASEVYNPENFGRTSAGYFTIEK